jgi:uncharacterized C2H2 Zn-finger protein
VYAVGSEYLRFLRIPKSIDGSPGDQAEDETAKNESDEEEYIRCRQCRQIITTRSDRIMVQGSHQHTFANPHGVVFHIGCFHSVSGCGYVGPAAEEFTWFRGYRWRIAVCGMCLTHLGWLFISRGNHIFNGLILDRLIEP